MPARLYHFCIEHTPEPEGGSTVCKVFKLASKIEINSHLLLFFPSAGHGIGARPCQFSPLNSKVRPWLRAARLLPFLHPSHARAEDGSTVCKVFKLASKIEINSYLLHFFFFGRARHRCAPVPIFSAQLKAGPWHSSVVLWCICFGCRVSYRK